MSGSGVLTEQVVVSYYSTPVSTPFSRICAAPLIALTALLSLPCQFSPLGLIVLESGVSPGIAVSLAVKRSHVLRLQHWLHGFVQQHKRVTRTFDDKLCNRAMRRCEAVR